MPVLPSTGHACAHDPLLLPRDAPDEPSIAGEQAFE